MTGDMRTAAESYMQAFEKSPIEVTLVDGLNETPALDLAIRGWADAQERNFGDGSMNCHSSLKAFIGWSDSGGVSSRRVPVGVITFENEPALKRVWVFQSYVLPEYRRRGIYTAMWDSLVLHAINECKAKSIQSGVHVKNVEMRAAAKSQGRIEEFIITRLNLG
jgi:hypothetical protein